MCLRHFIRSRLGWRSAVGTRLKLTHQAGTPSRFGAARGVGGHVANHPGLLLLDAALLDHSGLFAGTTRQKPMPRLNVPGSRSGMSPASCSQRNRGVSSSWWRRCEQNSRPAGSAAGFPVAPAGDVGHAMELASALQQVLHQVGIQGCWCQQIANQRSLVVAIHGVCVCFGPFQYLAHQAEAIAMHARWPPRSRCRRG